MEGGHSLPEKEEKGLSFMQELSEARLFKTRNQISNEGARSISDHIFVSILSLYIMSTDYQFNPVAVKYAARTNMYGAYNRPSPSGTDLYQALYSVQRPELFKGQAKDDLLMDKIRVEPQKIKKLLDQIKHNRVNSSTVSSELYRLERNLKIQDPKLRAARRLAQNWEQLNTSQRQLVATQINRYFMMNAMRSDIYPLFLNLLSHKTLLLAIVKRQQLAKQLLEKRSIWCWLCAR